MYRNKIEELKKWKNSLNRKPLIIRGARQVGKTWLMKEFGNKFYDKCAYINFDDNSRMDKLFDGDFDLERIIQGLKIESGVNIEPENTLIILDEIQETPKALKALKYFCENARQYHIISAGSLLGVAIHEGTVQYGTTRKYTRYYTKYPAIYAQEKYSGVDVSDVADGTQVITGSVNATAQAKMNPNGKTQSKDVYTTPTGDTSKTASTNLTCTQTYYKMSRPSSYFDDSNFYNMIFGTRTWFWLASRFVNCYSDDSSAYFGLRVVNDSYLLGDFLFLSFGGSDDGNYRLAPVVSLSSGIQVKSGSGTARDPYAIGK